MSDDDIVILRAPVDEAVLRRIVGVHFEGMAKFVVDVAREVIALGGAMHADAEARLLEDGSRQPDLWGANYYPGRGPDGCLEYTSLLNIRPRAGNRSMEVQDAQLRSRIREITFRLIGHGEETGWPPSTET